MKANPTPRARTRSQAIFAVLTFFSLAIVLAVSADDRDLLRKSAGAPYVFIIMDTSGSMSWTPPCDHLDAAGDINPFDGMCTFECPMDDATCSQVCPVRGCADYPATALPDLSSPGLQPIVVDDSDAGAFTATIDGVVTSPTSTASGFVTNKAFYKTGSDTFFDTKSTLPGSTASDPTTDAAHTMATTKKAIYRFTKELPAAGLYHVYGFWSSRTAASAESRVGVEYYDGSVTRDKYSEYDQKSGDRFIFLGTFDFRQNSSGKVPAAVYITNVNESNTVYIKGEINADAVAFIPVPKLPVSAACTRQGWLCQQPLCPEGDCFAPNSADDPTSKFFQARQAMYEVLSQIDDVHFGFGSYEQDNPRIMFKHWQYQIAPGQAAIYNFEDGLTNTIPFPEPGRKDMFGTGAPWDSSGRTTGDNNTFHCASSTAAVGTTAFNDDNFIGCLTRNPVDVNDLWEMERLRLIPKLGKAGIQETSLYVRTWPNKDLNSDGVKDFKYYRIDWETAGTQYDLGEPTIVVQMDVIWCKDIASDPTCSSTSLSKAETVVSDAQVTYNLVTDNAPYHLSIGRYPMSGNGFFNNQTSPIAERTCEGLEENDDWDNNLAFYSGQTSDSDDDAWFTYAFKRPWVKDTSGDRNPDGTVAASHFEYFDTGDFIPWDWKADNNKSIRNYLAPSVTRSTTALPDYRVATYFQDRTYIPSSGDTTIDDPTTADRKLRLRDDLKLKDAKVASDLDDDVYEVDTSIASDQKRRPLFAYGSTPIYKSVRNFKDWYFQWKKWAVIYDLDWQCRPKYLLFLTDGDETCDTGTPLPICATGNDISVLSGLSADEKVKTYVVGFGLPGGGDALTCMAKNGKTGPNNTDGVPILPRNKDELVTALTNIFNSIRTESFAFASASIPAVQSTAADKIYLSSFTPIQASSVWPGRLDAFRQPLPVTSEGKPDVTYSCFSPIRQSGCHLWDAAKQILDQAPTAVDLASVPPNFKLGTSFKTQRRVLYAQANPTGVRQALRLMVPPEKDAYPAWRTDRLDMAQVFMDSVQYNEYKTLLMTETTAKGILDDVVGQTLVIKEETLPVGPNSKFSCTGGATSDPAKCRYVMGDIFHANPTVLIGPSNFSYFKSDLCSPKKTGDPADAIPNNCEVVLNETLNRGYREFVARNVWRRRMLLSATNDGQLHFFDAGVYTRVKKSPTSSEEIDVFSDGTGYELFAYAPRMTMPAMRQQANDIKHVYSLDGSVAVGDVFIDPANATPVPSEREWRTVLVGGLREAGDVFAQTAHVTDIDGGYYALDVTQPDKYATVPVGQQPRLPIDKDLEVPTCFDMDPVTGVQKDVTGCQTLRGKKVRFPLELWTFQDQVRIAGAPYFLDEDGNGEKDLGATWSQPVIGQIAVCKGTAFDCKARTSWTSRWVAIFGGGNDPNGANKLSPKRGTYLYMVDIETGQAIYKRKLNGAAPSDPAVIDIDQDGLLDVIYIGTTTGYLYKVDLRKTDAAGNLPSVVSYAIPAGRVLGTALGTIVSRVTDQAWDPFVMVATGTTALSTDGAPIFYPPAMFKIPELNFYGGLLLVGDREDLWTPPANAYKSRIYVFVDENYTSAANIVASDLETLNYKSSVTTDKDFLRNPTAGKKRGWFMEVPAIWRSTGEPFLVAGVAIFSLFDPISVPTIVDGEKVCRRQGNTRGFSLFVKNGNPLANLPFEDECVTADDLCCGGRCFKIDEFTTAIHTTSTVTKNQPPGKRTDGGSYFGQQEMVVNAAQAAMLDAIRDAIMDSMPSSCQYNEKYEISFAVLRNSTGLNELARVPMMVCPGDWKD